ncbi:hypothetical protein DVH05_015743 [Phytophthora capsici]|nr:hypothetical protein DVH05_015743 [Phytophthora capsici]
MSPAADHTAYQNYYGSLALQEKHRPAFADSEDFATIRHCIRCWARLSANGNTADDEHFKDAKTEAFELEKEESDDDEDTAEEAGSSILDDGLTDAERSAKILAKDVVTKLRWTGTELP